MGAVPARQRLGFFRRKQCGLYCKNAVRGMVSHVLKPWHPEWAMVGRLVLSQVISVSTCEQNWPWSAHRHIHLKIRNRLEPATTVKLVYFTQTAKWWQQLEMQTNSRC